MILEWSAVGNVSAFYNVTFMKQSRWDVKRFLRHVKSLSSKVNLTFDWIISNESYHIIHSLNINPGDEI